MADGDNFLIASDGVESPKGRFQGLRYSKGFDEEDPELSEHDVKGDS